MSEPGEEPPAPNPRGSWDPRPLWLSERHPDSAGLARRRGGTGTVGPENARTQSRGTLGSPSSPRLLLCPQGSSRPHPRPGAPGPFALRPAHQTKPRTGPPGLG